MTSSASVALAVELHPISSKQWLATYYPMVETPAGRWADVTWTLHKHLMPLTSGPLEPAPWLEARSRDPNHPCYSGHHPWVNELAVGYAVALAVYDTADLEEPLPLHDAEQLRENSVVIAAGQLSEWVLNDLGDNDSYPTG